jgi:hypothetical protein
MLFFAEQAIYLINSIIDICQQTMQWTKDKSAKKTNHNLQNTTKKRKIEPLEPQFKTGD